jgi:branched-subunit amino acid transport protein
MKTENALPITLIGFAWPLFGMGYQAIVIRYLPSGAALVAESVGLFLAGALTGALLLTALDAMERKLGRALVVIGYLLFAPVGMMAALIAPAPFEPMGGDSWLTFSLVTPVLIILIASLAVTIGMGFTGGLALAVGRLNRRAKPDGWSADM